MWNIKCHVYVTFFSPICVHSFLLEQNRMKPNRTTQCVFMGIQFNKTRLRSILSFILINISQIAGINLDIVTFFVVIIGIAQPYIDIAMNQCLALNAKYTIIVKLITIHENQNVIKIPFILLEIKRKFIFIIAF